MRRPWGLCWLVVLLVADSVSAANLVFVPLTPCRVIDSSVAGGIFAVGETRSYTLRGPTTNYSIYGGSATGCGIPGFVGGASNVQNTALALALNVTAKNATGKGNFLAFPTNHVATASSTLNFNGIVTTPVNNGMNIANGAVIAMCDEIAASPCATGDLSVKASFGSAFLIVDVVGYFAEGETPNGTDNLALGHQALKANTSGHLNAATGYGALHANTSGYGNTGNGAFALYNNTVGTSNTASGSLALLANTTGYGNTASGSYALEHNTNGSFNTASGSYALFYNSGDRNTASGRAALFSNTSGYRNTASGNYALRSNTTGSRNTASGDKALYANTTGVFNTAVGYHALLTNATGYRNTALGDSAGVSTTGHRNLLLDSPGLAGENDTIRIGNSNHARAFLSGVRNVTTVNNNAIPVLIDSLGQLGTTSSSLRFKEDVHDMGEASRRLLRLRPVTFHYKQEVRPGEQPLEYGLIAEEVAAVFPELAVYGKDGKPETVKYHVLPALLLNELEKQQTTLERAVRENDAQTRTIAELRRELESLRREMQSMREERKPKADPIQ